MRHARQQPNSWGLVFFALVTLAGSIPAAEPSGTTVPATGTVRSTPRHKLVLDLWNAAYLEGQNGSLAHVGYTHTWVSETQRENQKSYHSSMELNLTLKRFRDEIGMRMLTGSEETADGIVTAVSMTQQLGKDKELVLRGTVEGTGPKFLHVTIEDRAFDRKIRWDDAVIGLYRQERLFQEKKVKTGDEFDYRSYEPSVTAVVTVHVKVLPAELVEVLGVKKKLLRVESTPDKLETPAGPIQMPTMVAWLDQELQTVRSQVMIDGLGKLILYRTSKATAQARSEGTTVQLPQDIGTSQLLRVNRIVPNADSAASIVYRVTFKDVEKPETAFASDEHQSVQNVKGNVLDVRVSPRREPSATGKPGKAAAEYLKSCYFLKSDDERVVKHARAAVGAETDPWTKAKLIERWVHDHIENKNFSEAFATADEVARTLEGDCTEHAVLSAAMCRAVGVPSRTALGLIYIIDRTGPKLAFHMWHEVWINGEWLGLDATLGRGGIGPDHLKIADQSWYDVQALTPLLPVLRVLGKVSIDVVAVERVN